MVFTIPAPTQSLHISTQKTYQYISNWLECHKKGGEVLPDEQISYSDDLLLSLVLSFMAPVKITCISGARVATPGSRLSDKSPEAIDQGVLALTLSSLMTLAKPVTQQNTPAYTKRWKAAMASAKVIDLVSVESWHGIITLSSSFTRIVAGREDLRGEIVRRVLALNKDGAEGAILTQIKLVWEYSSLKAVQYMDRFIKSHCRALEIPAVLDQALDLKVKWEAAHTSDPQLAYSRVIDINAHQELHHAHYPDLYYAAIAYARAHKMIGDNFQLSQTHTSRHTILIDKYVKKTAAAELGELSEDMKKKLQELGYPTSRRRHREDSKQEEEEDGDESRRRKRRR